MKDRLAERLGIYWPFPRLRYFLHHGHWCRHGAFREQESLPHGNRRIANGAWQMIDLGRRKMRRCPDCQHAEFT